MNTEGQAPWATARMGGAADKVFRQTHAHTRAMISSACANVTSCHDAVGKRRPVFDAPHSEFYTEVELPYRRNAIKLLEQALSGVHNEKLGRRVGSKPQRSR